MAREWIQACCLPLISRLLFRCGVLRRRRRAHEVALADFDTALPNDVIGGGYVKPEVWQAIAEQQALAGELACLPAREGNTDILALGAVNLALLDILEVVDGLGDAVLQLSNSGLVIGEFQKLLASETSRRVGRVISRRPHLPRQIEHVRRQPHVQKIGLVDLARGSPGCGLVEDVIEPVEVLDEDRNGNGVHGNRHETGLSWMTIRDDKPSLNSVSIAYEFSPAERKPAAGQTGKLADETGLDVFGVGEHHRLDLPISSPAVVMAAIAGGTKRIRLSSAVTILSTLDPVRVFQDFATVDLLSGGRAELIALRSRSVPRSSRHRRPAIHERSKFDRTARDASAAGDTQTFTDWRQPSLVC